jgi:beta-barrel assembly-enhancing protease
MPAEQHGFLLDGEKPVPQPVRISLMDDQLRLTFLADRKHTIWELKTIDWDASQTLPTQLRLQPQGQDQWLVITDEELRKSILQSQRAWRRRHLWQARPDTRVFGTIIAACLGTLITLWLAWPWLISPLAVMVPETTKTWLSQQARNGIGFHKDCSSPAGNAALVALHKRLSGSDPALRRARLQVVLHPLVNAVTLADDSIILTSGLLGQASGPDEIAGIIAHELGHVRERHVLRGLISSTALQMLVLVTTGGSTGLSRMSQLGQLSNSRAFENDADAIAIRLLQQANISTAGLTSFLGRMAAQEQGSGSFGNFLATHPLSLERQEHLQAIQSPAATEPAMSLTAWRDLQQICNTKPITPPDDKDDHQAEPLPKESQEL